MPIREFELFHGAVLTKLVRGDRPVTLRLIEQKRDSWSTYRINDEVNVLLKHSLNPQPRKRGGVVVWNFTFSPDQIKQLAITGTWAALVCGLSEKGSDEICLLDPDQLKRLLDLTKPAQQSLSVKFLPAKRLRVNSGRVARELVVPRSRLERWNVPGS